MMKWDKKIYFLFPTPGGIFVVVVVAMLCLGNEQKPRRVSEPSVME